MPLNQNKLCERKSQRSSSSNSSGRALILNENAKVTSPGPWHLRHFSTLPRFTQVRRPRQSSISASLPASILGASIRLGQVYGRSGRGDSLPDNKPGLRASIASAVAATFPWRTTSSRRDDAGQRRRHSAAPMLFGSPCRSAEPRSRLELATALGSAANRDLALARHILPTRQSAWIARPPFIAASSTSPSPAPLSPS